MPLSEPKSRQPIHKRMIECRGYERADGLWDIEGHLTDTKDVVHSRRHGGRDRQPGEPVHDMWIRLTIDLDMMIHDAEAATDASPYPVCGDVTPNFRSLRGVRIVAGWRREVAVRLGGVKGCTHLVEMLGPLGTVAYQATGRAREERETHDPAAKRPYQLNSCHIYEDGSQYARIRWPQLYEGK